MGISDRAGRGPSGAGRRRARDDARGRRERDARWGDARWDARGG
jgi:hypothetical protein